MTIEEQAEELFRERPDLRELMAQLNALDVKGRTVVVGFAMKEMVSVKLMEDKEARTLAVTYAIVRGLESLAASLRGPAREAFDREMRNRH